MTAHPVGVRIGLAIYPRTPIDVVDATDAHPIIVQVGASDANRVDIGAVDADGFDRLADACRVAAEHLRLATSRPRVPARVTYLNRSDSEQ